jgi:hypothetical protein
MDRISKDAGLAALEVVVNLVQILSYLCESSILGDFHFYGYFHVNLRVDAHLNTSFYLDDSSSSQHHFSPYLPTDLLPAQITHAYAPVLLIFLEGVFNILEISRRHHQYFLI